MNVVKSIAEIADEYERNLIRLKQRRDEVALLKLTIRPRSCRLTTATYFVYEGQRYDVLYWQPHYKRRDRLEVMLKLVVEDA